MVTRADDGDEQMRGTRLEVYARESKPLLDYYAAGPTFPDRSTARRRPSEVAAMAAQIDEMVPVACKEAVTMIVCRSAAGAATTPEANQLVVTRARSGPRGCRCRA